MREKRMRAAVVCAPGVVEVQDVAMPSLREYSVLCRNVYATSCTATDQHIVDRVFRSSHRLPTMLGHEAFGRIIELGPKVRHLSLGQRILRPILFSTDEIESCWGGYAEYGLAFDWRSMKEDGLPEKEWRQWMRCELIPDDISDETAPMLITWRETHSFITRMGVKPGMRVMVIGSGGTALSFMESAVFEGATVVAVGSPSRAETARKCGADVFISYRDPKCRMLMEMAAPEGYDLLIDSVGNEQQTMMALPYVKKGGVVGVYGINEPVNLPAGDYIRHDDSYLEGETHDRVVEGVRKGFYRAELFYDVEHPYPLEDISDALEMLRKREWPKALVRLQKD